jgi:thiamine biosynthesis lipoprotein ApbE
MHPNRVFHKNLFSMNSALDMVFTDIDLGVAELAFSEIQTLSVQLEKMLSCFDEEAEVFQLNQKAINGYCLVSSQLWNILVECNRFRKSTLGYFDIGLQKLKDQGKSNPSLDMSSKSMGMETIEFNEENHTIKFWSENTGIDLGAVGKGILLREVEKVLSKFDILNCFISFGGSSILTRGSHPHGSGWSVSMRGVNDPGFTFQLNNHTVSFSEAFPEGSSIATRHIIDPHTHLPIENKRITFVQSLCPVLAEVLSTTLIVTPLEDAATILSNLNPIKAYIYNKTDNQRISIEYHYGE